MTVNSLAPSFARGHLGLGSDHVDAHEFDGNGRPLRSKLNGAANWTHFTHDELTGQILAEYTLISSTFTIESVNTYGVGLISTNRESTKRYFHFDGLGSTMALTDGSQVVQDTDEFSAYGIQESSTGSSVNPFRFVGQWGYYDDGARGSTFGLLLLGIRYYDPTWGRFLAWDAVRTESLYRYGDCQPMIAIDPTGMDVAKRCEVFHCKEWSWEGGWGWVQVPSHHYICVNGPYGGCSGGLEKLKGKGQVTTGQSCKSRQVGNTKVECTPLTDRIDSDYIRCRIAAAVCECVRASVKSPPLYCFPIQQCYSYVTGIMGCACEKLSGDAKAQCLEILMFRL